MQVLYLDSNERMLEAERRVAASRLMIEIVKKAKNEKIEFIHQQKFADKERYEKFVMEQTMIFEDVRSEAIKSRDKYFAACDTIICLN